MNYYCHLCGAVFHLDCLEIKCNSCLSEFIEELSDEVDIIPSIPDLSLTDEPRDEVSIDISQRYDIEFDSANSSIIHEGAYVNTNGNEMRDDIEFDGANTPDLHKAPNKNPKNVTKKIKYKVPQQETMFFPVSISQMPINMENLDKNTTTDLENPAEILPKQEIKDQGEILPKFKIREPVDISPKPQIKEQIHSIPSTIDTFSRIPRDPIPGPRQRPYESLPTIPNKKAGLLNFFKRKSTNEFPINEISIMATNVSTREDCSICLNKYTSNSHVRLTQCGHKFHEHCLLTWIKLKKECPMCRSKFKCSIK